MAIHQDPFFNHARAAVVRLLHLNDDPNVPLSTNISMDGHLATVTIVSRGKSIEQLAPSMTDEQINEAIRSCFTK